MYGIGDYSIVDVAYGLTVSRVTVDRIHPSAAGIAPLSAKTVDASTGP